jgi:hypothetical protein
MPTIKDLQDAAERVPTTTPPADHDPIVLHSLNIAGNLHEASTALNSLGLAPYVLVMQSNGGNYTVVVLRLPLSEKLDLQSRKVL